MKQFFRNLWQFLKSRKFLINFGISLLAGLIVIWLIFKWLDIFTRHGQTIQVPNFVNLNVKQLNDFIKDKDVSYSIVDSIYDPTKPKGVVTRQEPDAGSAVKTGRTIYLYTTSYLPPKISMPLLEGLSLRAAVAMLQSRGLSMKGGKPHPTRDKSCNGCIVRAEFNGKRIEKGTLIEKGSAIDLYLGTGSDGDGGEDIGVPNLVGKHFAEAKSILEGKGLGWTIVPLNGEKLKDTLNATVVRQTPAAGGDRQLSIGDEVDVYLTNDKSKVLTDSVPE
jgi:beta-lactam-binding protein with PASTA domain